MAKILTGWGGEVFEFTAMATWGADIGDYIPWTSTSGDAPNVVDLSGKKYYGVASVGNILYDVDSVPVGIDSYEFQFTVLNRAAGTGSLSIDDTGGFDIVNFDKQGDNSIDIRRNTTVRETIQFPINSPLNLNVRIEAVSGTDWRVRVWLAGAVVYDYTDTALSPSTSFVDGNGGEMHFLFNGTYNLRNVAIYEGVTVDTIPKFFEMTDRNLATAGATFGHYANTSGVDGNATDADNTTTVTTTGNSAVIPSLSTAVDFVADKILINGRLGKSTVGASNTTIVFNYSTDATTGTDLYSEVVDAAHTLPSVGALGILDLGGTQSIDVGGTDGNRIGFRTP